MRANGSSLSRRTGKGVAAAVAPPPLERPTLAKRSLEQETEMTDATVEQQEDSKRRRGHPEVPQAADSSGSSSSSSESSTDTEMGLVDVCTIFCDSSEVSKRDSAMEKPVAVAEGREGGQVREMVTGNLSRCFQKGLKTVR